MIRDGDRVDSDTSSHDVDLGDSADLDMSSDV